MPHKKDTSWNKVAGWYNAHLEENDDTFQNKVILPNLLRLMNIQPGEMILDLACGQGFFSKAFLQAGARVIGTDLSPELIQIAQKSSPREIAYHVASADAIPMIKDNSINKITIILSIQNIENVPGVLKECHRVLTPGGRVYMVLNHPTFRIPKRSSWGWDQEQQVQYRRIDGYMTDFRTQIEMHPGKIEKTQTVSFHRPLQYYFKLLSKNGFAVTRLEEWISHKKSQQGPRAQMEDTARKEFPLFLFLELHKQ